MLCCRVHHCWTTCVAWLKRAGGCQRATFGRCVLPLCRAVAQAQLPLGMCAPSYETLAKDHSQGTAPARGNVQPGGGILSIICCMVAFCAFSPVLEKSAQPWHSGGVGMNGMLHCCSLCLLPSPWEVSTGLAQRQCRTKLIKMQGRPDFQQIIAWL